MWGCAMRVVTTSHKAGLDDYGHRWLDSRKNWPKGTEFRYYTEGFDVDCDGKDFADLPEFMEWKIRHARYRSPDWRFDVVAFAHKVFAIRDALYDYDGVGVWLDADAVTYAEIPRGLIQSYVARHYVAGFQRVGMHTETGMIVFDCAHPLHKPFLDKWASWYLTDAFKQLHMWTDCHTFDATCRQLHAPVNNLSREHSKEMHPMALAEIGKYCDHQKGLRKDLDKSPENAFR
jgi:hypothetical protein